MAEDPDAQYMLQIQEGRTGLLEVLVERHRRPLMGYLYRMVQVEAVAEDLAQETFLRVYRARRRYMPTAKFTSWLYRIAANLALNWLRDHKAERWGEHLESERLTAHRWADERPGIEQRLIRAAERNEVRNAILSLPPRQRSAIVLHKYHGMPHAQIARAMGTTETAVRSLMYRGYGALRRRLAHLRRGQVASSRCNTLQ
jgi:RNA polymerase sigma-70 factor (ECF subfamily)